MVFSTRRWSRTQADAEILQVILNLNNMSLSGHVVGGGEGQGQRGVDPPHRTRQRRDRRVARYHRASDAHGCQAARPGGGVTGPSSALRVANFTPSTGRMVGTKWKDVQLMLPEAVPDRHSQLEERRDHAEPEPRPRDDRAVRAGGHRRGQ